MRIISYYSARTTWLFPLEEIGPLKGMNGANLVTEISTRYEFKSIPVISTAEETQKNGIKFGLGKLAVADRVMAVTELAVYSDGIVVISEDTETSRLFLIDLIAWLRQKFDFRDFSSPIKEVFLSEVVVEFDAPLARLIAPFNAISTLVSKHVGPIYQTKEAMGFARFDLEFDRTSPNVKHAAPRFVIERRASAAFEQERYFCSAPMRTSDHVETLLAIERFAAAV